MSIYRKPKALEHAFQSIPRLYRRIDAIALLSILTACSVVYLLFLEFSK